MVSDISGLLVTISLYFREEPKGTLRPLPATLIAASLGLRKATNSTKYP